VEEELIDCRYDHYQTRTDIYLSIYAKQVDKERSKVQFEENSVSSPPLVEDFCLNKSVFVADFGRSLHTREEAALPPHAEPFWPN
jgi:hypothetical protein